MTEARVGIDVGGTKCLGVALDEHGEVVAEQRVPTPHDAVRLVEVVANLANVLGAGDRLGVAVPGLVTRDGVLLAAPNLTDVADLPLRRLLEERTSARVVLDNDNTAACYAEWRLGAGRGCDDLVVVGIGTGIGGGFVSGGRLQRGRHGFAGEFGHMVVDPAGPACPCGQHGCWERYASGHGLGHFGRVAARNGRLAAAATAAGGVDEVRGEHVTAAARIGDTEALAVISAFATWVAVGLVNLTNLFDPERIVLAGGVSADADVFLPPIEVAFRERLFASSSRPRPDLRFAALGPRAGAIGAALLADN